MHNKLAGTKEFGRTIRIHNTPPPPHPTPPPEHAHNLSHPFTLARTLHTGLHTKLTKRTATWTH